MTIELIALVCFLWLINEVLNGPQKFWAKTAMAFHVGNVVAFRIGLFGIELHHLLIWVYLALAGSMIMVRVWYTLNTKKDGNHTN
ncbi:hypothetical protein [Marinimicrobium sp. ABcell2]|uniref:hypothetical protein n=1 Tax=Marinimicrobium sp. ABcell2 TaxID=3069751 RepID=UPI0027B17023|nr:hypothetical protein [Marinimicrobium sp. ABcell2]MDQ2077373.1 hypothetical protein [Marinimicrobium sp. ABcell2]